jgi:hypothetical protein
MSLITISIDEDIKKVIEKRAKKNMSTLREQVEDIVRQSAVRTKSGISASQMKSDDRLVEIFSRNKRGRKKRKG